MALACCRYLKKSNGVNFVLPLKKHFEALFAALLIRLLLRTLGRTQKTPLSSKEGVQVFASKLVMFLSNAATNRL